MELKEEKEQTAKVDEYITYRSARWMVSRAISEYEARRAAEEYAKVEAAAKEKAQVQRDNDQWFNGYLNGAFGGILVVVIGYAVACLLNN